MTSIKNYTKYLKVKLSNLEKNYGDRIEQIKNGF